MGTPWTRSTLAAELLEVAARFIRIRQSQCAEDPAISELTTLSIQAARLFSEAGKLGFDGFFDITPAFDRWQPPIHPSNPLHQQTVDESFLEAWQSIMVTVARMEPDRVGGGLAVGGAVFHVDCYDAETGDILGVRNFQPDRWREFAEASAATCRVLSAKLNHAEPHAQPLPDRAEPVGRWNTDREKELGPLDNSRTRKLPTLRIHDRQAWQLSLVSGMTQDKVAAALNKQHGTTYKQGQVSRMISRAKAHAEASGLADKLPKPIARPRTIDPHKLELGARVDKRRARPSDMPSDPEDG